mmetsp:Transcript_13340/g.35797  ORF Transcript_13340/g.35797 Transcript_13340/m.35797 type:complete len:219 (+) Transcript_13340:1362-2018(+)
MFGGAAASSRSVWRLACKSSAWKWKRLVVAEWRPLLLAHGLACWSGTTRRLVLSFANFESWSKLAASAMWAATSIGPRALTATRTIILAAVAATKAVSVQFHQRVHGGCSRRCCRLGLSHSLATSAACTSYQGWVWMPYLLWRATADQGAGTGTCPTQSRRPCCWGALGARPAVACGAPVVFPRRPPAGGGAPPVPTAAWRRQCRAAWEARVEPPTTS